MIWWLVASSVRRAPRRLALAALAVAFPVAMLAATLLYVDAAVRSMTAVALAPVQVEQRGVATSLDVDTTAVARRMATVPGDIRVERFAAADVVVGDPATGEQATARLFAVDPDYPHHHPWVHLASGALDQGALLNETLRSKPGLGSARQLSIELSGGSGPLATLPVGGTVDLRQATTWFAIPTGEVQGDIAAVPRAIVIDYTTFQRSLLPALRHALGPATSVLNPGATDLPPVDLEVHVAVDHAADPSDPSRAAGWSATLQRVLERQVPGAMVVADDAAEALSLAQADATNAKVLFLLLGIPGVLVAAALGLAAESALAEAHRREEALLRLRGASERQLVRLTAAQAALAGVAGAVVGVAAAVAAVSAVDHRPIWRLVPVGRLAVSLALALVAGAVIVGVRLVQLVRTGRRAEVPSARRLLERGWAPAWRRARLDLVAITVGVVILAANQLTGGLRRSAIEGTSLALFFYVLLAPIALWLGVTLLALRGLLAGVARRTRPERASPLGSWRGAALRWLGRRPARTAVALLLGTLAVAFGTEAVAFVATYQQARHADMVAALGSDLRLVPASEPPAALPRLGPAVAAASPVRYVGARVGSDRKTIIAVDPASYPGAVTVFPDDQEKRRNLNLRVVGVFRSAPPTDPGAELVTSIATLPSSLLPPPDFYLARAAGSGSAGQAADALRSAGVEHDFRITTIAEHARSDQRSLTALNLAGLSRIESAGAGGAGVAAALGVAVLGAFLVLERRRERRSCERSAPTPPALSPARRRRGRSRCSAAWRSA